MVSWDHGFIDGEDVGALMVVKDRRTGTLVNTDFRFNAVDDYGVECKADHQTNSDRSVRGEASSQDAEVRGRGELTRRSW
eukprot:12569460-Heterocapsa_arctica.AAC.1